MCLRLCCQKKILEEDDKIDVLEEEKETRNKLIALKNVNTEIVDVFRQS